MARKKKEEGGGGGSPAWMTTFSDLMNLLLCFFVLLFSMSTMDAQKLQQVAASFNQNFSIFSGGATAIGDGILISNGVSQLNELDDYINSTGKTAESDQTVNDLEEYEQQMAEKQLEESEQLAEKVEEAIDESQFANEIDVDFTSQYVSLTLNGALLFDSGSADIKEEAKPVLDKIGQILSRYAESTVEIEGHTDNVPIHNSRFADNNELSSFRALSIFNYLMETTFLDPAKIKHSGRGEYVPVADNSTDQGRAQNRRVEIKIYHSLSTGE
ncbi:MAG: flagellar motor protein MotB [Lachnospiraceae bacterium]|nr:flagellar motor protein MotB [Lachnospiraceae bacterium]